MLVMGALLLLMMLYLASEPIFGILKTLASIRYGDYLPTISIQAPKALRSDNAGADDL